MIPSGSDRDLAVYHRAIVECRENLLGAIEFCFRSKALQDLSHDQVANHEPRIRQSLERVGFGGRPAVEVVNPDRGIDHDHRFGKRSRRIAFRLPSQCSFPRADRISLACSASRTISSSPRSTASRLVAAPETRIAFFIKASLITILVRTTFHSSMCMLR